MEPTRKCKRCGTALAATAKGRVCPACLLRAGLADPPPDAEETSREPASPAKRLFGDYEVIEEIARGGMGVVYKARQAKLNRIVAVKVILSGKLASPSEITRFRTEAETAARLQHPNIVAIHEIGEHEGHPFFSMDFVAGQTLAELVRDGPLSARQAAMLVERIAEAIHYAHGKGVLHRDLKPSNVILDDAGEPRITDFGLAKWLEGNSDLTLTGHVLGSPSFMPPEQARGDSQAVGPPSDVYSIGAILYQLLTGRPPFLAETLTQTLRLVAETDPVSPRLLNPAVPRDLETICLKCLDKDSQRRYGTAQALAEDVDHFLKGESIDARPASQVEKGWRWCLRNPASAGAGVAVILLLLTVAIGSTVAAARLHASNRAGQERLRESLISQARAGRWSGRVGQRFDGLDALKKAAEIRRSVDLRNETIACLALVDMRPVKVLDKPAGTGLSFDPTYSRYVRGDAQGNFIVRRMRDDTELTRFPGLPASPYGPWFSPRGRYLAISRVDGNYRPLQICDLDRHEVVFTLTNSHVRDLDFSPDERFVYVAQSGIRPCKILRIAISSRESRELRQLPEVPSAARLDPAGSLLAISSTESRKVQILNAANGDILFSLEHSNVVHGLRWHPDGRLLATACGDGQVYLWDTIKGDLSQVIGGHESVVTSVSFSHNGDLGISGGWDGTARLWNVWTGRQILSRSISGWLDAFSADDGLLAVPEVNSVEVCEVAGGREWRGFYLSKNTVPFGSGSGWSPDGRVFASAYRDGVRLWDTGTGREIGLLPSDLGEPWFVLFDPAGSNLVTTTDVGIRYWPVKWARGASGDKLLLGARQKLGPSVHTGGGLFFSQRGDLLLAEVGGAVLVFDWPSQHLLQRFEMEDPVFRCTLSPGGRFCAAWPRSGKPIRVWDVGTGLRLKDFDFQLTGDSFFTPDDRLLFTARAGEYQAWDTRSWTNVWKLPRSPHQPNQIAFNHGGTMGGLTLSGQKIRLFEPATGGEFADLEAPDQQVITWLAFNPDGSHLAATTATSVVHMWDLRLIRQELAAMKLDWNSPPFPPSPPHLPDRRLTVVTTDSDPDLGPKLPQSPYPTKLGHK